MGIKGINKLLKEKVPAAFDTMPIRRLWGKRVAIDGNNWMFAAMAIARKKVVYETDVASTRPDPEDMRRKWLASAVSFINMWLLAGVTPVFVFDGEHPDEKTATKDARKADKEAHRVRIEEIYAIIQQDVLAINTKLMEELRRELSNYVYISSEDYKSFYQLILVLGVPCIRAAADAEQLCSMLARERVVSAVFSGDTDNLAYGCPLLITKVDKMYYDANKQMQTMLSVVRVEIIIRTLELSESQFLDLCIMAGCDFNVNMRGYAAGKSLVLLRKYGSIENLPKEFNTDCLAYVRCREIFAPVPSDCLITQINNKDFQLHKEALDTAQGPLTTWGLAGIFYQLLEIYQNAPLSSEASTLRPCPLRLFVHSE